MVVGHMCGHYGRKPSPAKVDCKSVTEVRRFLGACAHIVEPLYELLKKGRKFEWSGEHVESVRKMKEALAAASALRKAVYGKDVPIYVTVDMSLTGIEWVINQEDGNGARFPIRYAQVKRELWGIISAVKIDKDYLIGTKVIIATDFLPILGMVSGCATLDLAMLRWIAYIKSLNPEIRHISRKDNAMADMLSRARFENEDNMVLENKEIGADFFKSAQMKGKGEAARP